MVKKCFKCQKEIDDNALFCPFCGSKVKSSRCPKCHTENDDNAKYCSKCGTKLDNNEKEESNWKLDSKMVFLFLWTITIFGSFLLSSPGLANPVRLVILYRYRTLIGFLFLIFGTLYGFILNKKEISIKEEFSNLKKLQITKVQIGLMFTILSVATLFKWGSLSQSGETYFLPSVLVFGSVCGLILSVILKNKSKLPFIGQFATFLGSILSFIGAISLYNYGNELNHNTESKLESFFASGNANPGDTYINYALYLALLGVVLLVLFFIIRTRRKK